MILSVLPLSGWIQIALLVLILIGLGKPIGAYMAHILSGETVFLTPVIAPLERLIYCLCRIDPDEEMSAMRYFKAFLAFTFISFLTLFFMMLWQIFPDVSPALALEASISLITGTDWQPIPPETTYTNLTQQYGFAVQNFLSCSVAVVFMAVMARGFARTDQEDKLGNFWIDITRFTLYVLLPLSLVFGVFLVSQGVVMSFSETISFTTLETDIQRLIPIGPIASQVAIKQLGTNGGGYFMANAAHPFENPTPLSNFTQIIALLLIPTASVFAFGDLVKAKRQSWMLLSTMLIVFIPAVILIVAIEHAGNPFLESLGIHSALGNMEGKELRFSAAESALFAAAAGATSGGALNSSLDSFMPLGGLIPLFLMQLGELIFGGGGTGVCNLVMYALFAVFTASLMIGRSPQYLGKRIGISEMKMVAGLIIIPPLLTLTGTALAVMCEAGQSGAVHEGAQGFSQILYAFTSATNNNGSSMGGINANSTFYHITLSIAMLLGRLGALGVTTGLAHALAKQTIQAKTDGVLKTETPFFVFFLILILFLSMLTYLPSLAIGPVVEHITLGGNL